MLRRNVRIYCRSHESHDIVFLAHIIVFCLDTWLLEEIKDVRTYGKCNSGIYFRTCPSQITWQNLFQSRYHHVFKYNKIWAFQRTSQNACRIHCGQIERHMSRKSNARILSHLNVPALSQIVCQNLFSSENVSQYVSTFAQTCQNKSQSICQVYM